MVPDPNKTRGGIVAKAKRLVDKGELQAELIRQELTREFRTRTELFEAVAASPWGKSQDRLTPVVVYLRVKEFKLGAVLKTPANARGGGKGGDFGRSQGITPSRGPRTSRADKMKKFGTTFEILDRVWGEEAPAKLAKAHEGSVLAFVALKCLDCSNGCRREIRECTVLGCPLYPIRPYQGSDASAEIEEPLDPGIEAVASEAALEEVTV